MTVGRSDTDAGGVISIAAVSLLACVASSIRLIEKRVPATQWLAARAMVLAPESTNAVKPSNNHMTLRWRLTVSVCKFATTIPSLPALRRCAAPGGASLRGRSWNREACGARHLIPSSVVQDARPTGEILGRPARAHESTGRVMKAASARRSGRPVSWARSLPATSTCSRPTAFPGTANACKRILRDLVASVRSWRLERLWTPFSPRAHEEYGVIPAILFSEQVHCSAAPFPA